MLYPDVVLQILLLKQIKGVPQKTGLTMQNSKQHLELQLVR